MIEENKNIMRKLFEEAFHQGDLAVVDELFDEHFVDHSTPEQPVGRQGVKEYIVRVRTDFPDVHITLDHLIAEGELVAVRTTWYGTYRGPEGESASAGMPVTSTMIQIFRIRHGKILEEWNEGPGLSG